MDRLHGARGGRPLDLGTLRVVGFGNVHERLVAVEAERLGCEETALRVPLAQREIDDEPHAAEIVTGSQPSRARPALRVVAIPRIVAGRT